MLKLPGRVGDTPLVGAGLYAHPVLGAAAATGVGEAIIAHVMAYELLRQGAEPGGLQRCAEELCARVQVATRSAVGLIALRPDGEVAVAHASDHMSHCIARGDEPPVAALSRLAGATPPG
jgi:isoaspartyl peptidase/L-asparaginase-like protein (Ntn-hydrolase superfamily)